MPSQQQRQVAPEQEQLDWLYTIQEELSEQTRLLERMARHTGFIYFLAIVWTILTILGVVTWIVLAH